MLLHNGPVLLEAYLTDDGDGHQPLSNKACVSCGEDPSGTASRPGAHWAGGEGWVSLCGLFPRVRLGLHACMHACEARAQLVVFWNVRGGGGAHLVPSPEGTVR